MAASEFITDEYIDKLPHDATMGFVFADLYVRGNLLANDLEEKVLEADSGRFVPDTALEISGTSAAMGDDCAEEFSDEELARHSRFVSARELSQLRYLFRVTQEGPIGEGLFPKPSDAPVSVSAFRDCVLPIGDYYLDKHDQTIVCTIGHIIDSPPDEQPNSSYDHEEPYTGDSDHDADAKVADLDTYEKKRLRIVTNAIELGISRARLLRDGADFYEMFEIDKPREPSLSKRFSFRAMFSS